MSKKESKWAENYAIWKKASGGKWWLYQYFKLADYELRKANPGKPKIKEPNDRYEILKKE